MKLLSILYHDAIMHKPYQNLHIFIGDVEVKDVTIFYNPLLLH